MKIVNHYLKSILLIFPIISCLIYGQYPTVSDILNSGYIPSTANPQYLKRGGNLDEFAVTDPFPFMVKVNNYPPAKAFWIKDGEEEAYYFSFDSDANYSPVKHRMFPNTDNIVKTYRIDKGGNYTSGWSVIVEPPTAVDVGAAPDFIMKYDGSFHAVAWVQPHPWGNFVTPISSYTPNGLEVIIEGEDELEYNSSSEYIANINGGSGKYGIFWSISDSQQGNYTIIQIFQEPDDEYFIVLPGAPTPDPADWNYYLYDQEYKYTLEMLYDHDVFLKVEVSDLITNESVEYIKAIQVAPEPVTFINLIEGSENYGELLLNENTSDSIQSGDNRNLNYQQNYSIRTAELPFIVNGVSSGKTQKHHSWENITAQNPNVLKYQFEFASTSSKTMKASFKSTDDVTLKTKIDGMNSSASIDFKDPWYYFQDQNMNWVQSDDFIEYPTPFEITNNSTNSYGGVFLSVSGPPFWESPFYEIQAPENVTIENEVHKLYFLNWNEDPSGKADFENASSSTGVVFKEDGVSVEANMKGSLISNNSSELDNSSHRKFVRSSDGNLHMVYESMDRVWYEMSTDNGVTWDLKNDQSPLSINDSKNPTIAAVYWNMVVIAFQEENYPNYSNIKVILFDIYNDVPVSSALLGTGDCPFTNNSAPAISCENLQTGQILVVWQDVNSLWGPWLAYATGGISNYTLQFNSSYTFFPGDQANASSPTIANHYTSNGTFYIAWEKPISTNSSKIFFTTLSRNIDNTYPPILAQNIDEPSLGCGYTKNYSPSIVVMDDYLPRLTWVGERDMEQEENTAKVNGIEAGTIQKRVILRGRNSQGVWNPTIFTYGSNVNKVSMSYNETGTIGGYAFAWTENETAPFNYKHVKNTTLNYSPMPLYSVEGKYLQLCNGDDFSDMYAMGLTETLPYAFNLSENLSYTGGQQEAKVNSGNFASIGREGIITNGDAEFYFTIKDVLVENTEISFSEVNENTTYSNLSEFNSYLSTEPFELNNNSSFLYTVQYGLIERDSIISPLGEGKFINFKVQLIDAVSNDLIGEFDNVTYTDDDIYQYANIGYQVNTEGIGERTVKLKLVVDYNIAPVYSLSTLYTEENLLAKRGLHQIGFEGSLEVKEYHLAQNYPNPFNPATTINYQIPQDGAVKLVIYDALGREVRTLVNEYKTKGRYEAVFNANDLASGVYIYHLKVNDFVQTRKMMLLK